MTRILAVLNQKGGVGKTTTCVNLGAALARRGFKVLLIDMDPQANLTVHLGGDLRDIRRSTYSLLLSEHALGPAVRQTATPGLRYVPSTLALANAEIQLASAVGRELLLREAIEGWLEEENTGEESPRAHFIIIDCPPSLGILTMNALCAANEVVLPIQTEFFALQGVAGILESLKAVQRLNRGLRLSMVVPCMWDRRTTLARDVVEEVEKYFGKLVAKTRIRNNVKLAEAPSHGMTIFEYDASSNGAKDYMLLAREVLGESLDDPEPKPARAKPAARAGAPDDDSESADVAPPADADETRTAAVVVAEAPNEEGSVAGEAVSAVAAEAPSAAAPLTTEERERLAHSEAPTVGGVALVGEVVVVDAAPAPAPAAPPEPGSASADEAASAADGTPTVADIAPVADEAAPVTDVSAPCAAVEAPPEASAADDLHVAAANAGEPAVDGSSPESPTDAAAATSEEPAPSAPADADYAALESANAEIAAPHEPSAVADDASAACPESPSPALQADASPEALAAQIDAAFAAASADTVRDDYRHGL